MKYDVVINATHATNIDFHTCFDPWRFIWRKRDNAMFLTFFKDHPKGLPNGSQSLVLFLKKFDYENDAFL